MFLKEIRDAINTNLASRLGGAIVAPSLRRVLARLDPAAHNGAPLLGLKGVAVKMPRRNGCGRIDPGHPGSGP